MRIDRDPEYFERSINEIAEATGVTPQAVFETLRRAMRKFCDRFEDDPYYYFKHFERTRRNNDEEIYNTGSADIFDPGLSEQGQLLRSEDY